MMQALPIACLLAVATSVSAQDPELFEIIAANELTAWRTLGPFHSPEHQGLEMAFIDEEAAEFAATHSAGTRTLVWTERDFPDGRRHAFEELGVDDWDTLYLSRTITAIEDHRAAIAFGFDDSAAVWVNGAEVFRQEANDAVVCGKYSASIELAKGPNSILLKVVNNKGDSGFCFSLTEKVDNTGNRWGAGKPDDGFEHYEISRVPVPDELRMEVGGLLFQGDGSLLVACRRGQIYRIHNPEENDPTRLEISTFAEGLHEPLGMLLDVDGSLLVAQKPELTRIRDTDGDGRADSFETVTQPWGMSGNYHEYHFGPVRDREGNLWCTLNIGFPSGDGAARLYRGSAYRLTPEGEFLISCTGIRSPNGLVTNQAGDVFYTDNQGEWMDVCRLAHLQPKKFYGHEVPLQWSSRMPDFGWETERTLPAVWYPYHLLRSNSQPVVDTTAGKFGPYAGQIIVGDQNNALLARTTLQLVNGVYQGACYPFWQGFDCGVNRIAFDENGVLFCGLTERGWGSVGPKSYGLQRIRFVGPEPFDLLEVTATNSGFDLRFTKPIAAETALTPADIHIREYGYDYSSTYGSDEVDSRDVEIQSVTVSAGRTQIAIVTGRRHTGKAFQIQVRGELRSEDGARPITQEAFYTLLEIPN